MQNCILFMEVFMSEQKLLREVTDILHQLGLPAHIKGYYYLRESIIMSIYNPELLSAITKQLYPEIARNNNSSPASVERAMRHAIELAWRRGNMDSMTFYFGYSISSNKGKPTNSEFISMIADHVKINYMTA